MKTNNLMVIAFDYMNKALDETVRNDDMTQLFYHEISKIIESKERLNITINGLPARGKSTTGMSIVYDLLKKHYEKEMNISNIAREQSEYLEMMQNDKIHDTILLVDEWDDMNETGENSTTESALRNLISKVHAQRNIHIISCSPEDIADPLSDIILEVVAKDTQKQNTRCFLYYNIKHNGGKMQVLLGYVDINVKNVINKKWYEEYRKRKFAKMDLITKQGIFRPKELKYAKAIKKIIGELKDVSRLGFLDTSVVRNYVEIISREEKIPFSLLGVQIMTQRAEGMLKLYKSKEKVEQQISKLEKEIRKNPETEEYNRRKVIQLEQANNQIGKVLERQIAELVRKVKIKEEYEKIE